MTIHDATGFFSAGRLRVRRVNETRIAEQAAQTAAKNGRPSIKASDGGDVANCYGYPAETEGIVAVALDAETVVVFGARLPANKVTLSGVAGAACNSAWPLFDGRVTDHEWRRTARRETINRARAIVGFVPLTEHPHACASSRFDGALSPLLPQTDVRTSMLARRAIDLQGGVQ